MGKIRCFLILLVVLTFFFVCKCESAYFAVTSSITVKDGKTFVVLSNPYFQLTFEPGIGGRCVSFKFLDTNEEIIPAGGVNGMFIDHWAKYAYPSGLMWLPYQYEIVKDGDRKTGIRLWVTVPAKGGGKGEGAPLPAGGGADTSPELVGLIVQKTIWISADTDLIEVDYEYKNPTNESRSVAPYIQHLVLPGGTVYHNTWYLPSTRGVQLTIQPDNENGRTIGPDWILDPTAGWMGVLNRKTNRGLVFIFDYNYVQKIYTCGMTAEWFFDAVPLSPGKSFKSVSYIKPVSGFKDFTYASSRIIADISTREQGKKVVAALDLTAATAPLTGLSADIKVTAWKSKETIATSQLSFPSLGYSRKSKEFSFTPKTLTDGVIIRVILTGPGFTEKFERYYAGEKAEHERRYNYFATKGGALAGSRGDAYFLKQPKKIKNIEKPDFSKIAGPSPDKFKCLVIFGLYTQILNIDDALASWKNRSSHPVTFDWDNCPPNAAETFPGSYDELFSYNVIVLSDVNYKALGDIGFEMICDYVEQGGNLLVTGGPYSLGNGEFEDTRFLEILPATLSGPFDLKWAGKAKSWELTPAGTSSPILKGVSFTQNPRVFWNHSVSPKNGADVILKAGTQPALITGTYGKGKIVLLTLSPTGLEGPGETAWWSWDGWPVLASNIFTWFDNR